MGESDDDAFVELFGEAACPARMQPRSFRLAIAASLTLYKTAKIEGINIF